MAAVMAAARARRWARRPSPWATRCFCTVDLAMENPWSLEPVGVLATANGGLDHGQGQQGLDDMGGGGFGHLGRPALLGHQGVQAVAVGHALPLVVAGAGDAEDPAGLGHIARALGVVQHGEASLVDDLCWGHGDGLLGSVMGTTESIAGPLKGVDVQPQPSDRKA